MLTTDCPILLLSSERSGSNLIRVMMGSHREVSAPASAQVIKTLVPLIALYGRVDGKVAERIAGDMIRILETQLGSWTQPPTVSEIVNGVEGVPSFGKVLMALYGTAMREAGKTRIFIKDNGIIPHAFALSALYPDAHFVYLVRDPRDVALSWKRSPGHPGGVREAARMWVREQTQALQFLAIREGSSNPVILIRYEDLVASPREVLEGLLKQLGLDFDEEMLRFHEGEEAQRAATTMSGWANLQEPLLANNCGKYKEGLSAKEIEAVERIAGAPMKQLGYLKGVVTNSSGRSDDLIGKLFRAGRTLLQHVPMGRKGYYEFQRRVRRLKALRQIESQCSRKVVPWQDE